MKKPATPSTTPARKSFSIVAIGASAGGLEAVTQLLRNLASDTGMAFIYVQHLSPYHETSLPMLLSRSTKMKVQEVRDKMLIEPNHLYIIPPDKEMTVADGHLRITPRKKGHYPHLPIDALFSSLAEKHDDQVIGIVLSGGGSDGTRGLEKIKQQGGLTFVQDGSARFGFMPHAAIAQGIVDYILSPKEIALALMRLSKGGDAAAGKSPKAAGMDAVENKYPQLKAILQVIYRKKKMDFSHYKMNTIRRRTLRRMQLHNLETLKQYLHLLEKNDDEVDVLCKDLLINVTSFFREPATFRYLREILFPRLLRAKAPGETLRLWVTACSTGEEAYSMVITLMELQEKISEPVPVQIFATDLSEPVIRKARLGEYTADDLKMMPSKLVAKYFTKTKEGYRISRALRESCMFAQHNILYDPPFSNVDFISCCNLLIYLDNTAQKKVITTFHYALRDNGYLMLGKSETIGMFTSLFTPVNKKQKIYSRNQHTGLRTIPAITPRFLHPGAPVKTGYPVTAHLPASAGGHVGTVLDALLLSRYIPTCVVINREMEIIEVRGATEQYLRLPPGKASFNILKMARPDIAFELRNAIHHAFKLWQPVRKKGIEMKTAAGLQLVSIELTPLKIESEEPLLLILFSQQPADPKTDPVKPGKRTASTQRTKKLEEELSALRADIMVIAHDHEATIEDLQSANEEVVSSNEELRTLNEELETTKEEIESTNDELLSANEKLQQHSQKVEELNKYSKTIIATIHNPMLILDSQLCVKSANQPFYKQFEVGEEIIGKKLFSINHRQWRIPALQDLLEDTLNRNVIITNFELAHTFKYLGEKILLLNIRQVQQRDPGEQLIMLVIEDVTAQANLRKKEQLLISQLRESNQQLEDMNNELKAFNYVSSHDLQEPLRKIKTFINHLVKEEQQHLSKNAGYYFERIQTSVDRMHELIIDLLAYSHASVKDQKFEKVSIASIVTEVKKEFAETIREKHAIIESSTPGRIKMIRFQLRQLLLNLVGNALKYSSPKRQPRIRISGRIAKGSVFRNSELQPDTSYYHLSIKDNGIGFDPKFNERIFGVFERLHDKDEYDGTGIGLAICKKIVKNHHGVITASGKKGKGATFDVYLPV